MEQNPNTPPPNQNQNQNQNYTLGFGQYGDFMSILTSNSMSPNIPNQPHFAQTTSPPIPFQNIFQTQNPSFQHYQQTQFQQGFTSPQFQQGFTPPQFQQGGSSSVPNPISSQPPPSQDVVYETQMEAPDSIKRKKATKKATRKGKVTTAQDKPIPWSEGDLVALADSWCTTSQDEIRGNDQKATTYWEAISQKFQAKLGQTRPLRNTDALSSKWSDMNRKITKFNGIFTRVENNKPSGWNEMQVFQQAKIEYKETNNNNDFTLDRVWQRVRFEPKWLSIAPCKTRSTSGSKRSRGESSMASDGHINIDLNAGSDAFQVDDDDVEEVDPLHNRPKMGRDKAKRVAKFGQDQEAKAVHRELIERKLSEHLETAKERKELRRQQLERQKQFEEQQAELVRQQQLINHLSILEKGGVKDEDVEIVEEAKAVSRSWIKKLFKK